MLRLIFLLLIQFSLWANAFELEDPTFYHNVNVITGQLHLSSNDVVVSGPVPLSLTRSYTSGGAFESAESRGFYFKKKTESWMFQGGWNFLPHLKMLIFKIDDKPNRIGRVNIYLAQKTGNFLEYELEGKKNSSKKALFKPKEVPRFGSGGRRNDPNENRLEVYYRDAKAILYTPDGSIYYYSGPKKETKVRVWNLDLEILPSKHRIVYSYDGTHLKEMALQNPLGTQTFSSITFHDEKYQSERVVTVRTSDKKELSYEMMEFKGLEYLKKIQKNFGDDEVFHYQPGRKGIGGRVAALNYGKNQQFAVTYYGPEDKKQESKWADDPRKVKFHSDKVHLLQIPDPTEGQLVTFAEFSYFPEYTEVKDCDGSITRYHHQNSELQAIEYFTSSGEPYSSIRYEWKDHRLLSKTLLDANKQIIAKKEFSHNAFGDVIKEELKGNITGHSGNDTFTKIFDYQGENNLPSMQKEDHGPRIEYDYLKGTDLLTAKYTHGDIHHQRQFLFYNEDNLLVKEIIDDGFSHNSKDLAGITERHITYYRRDPITGLCKAIVEKYLDITDGQEKQLHKRKFIYSDKRQVLFEEHFDENNTSLYTLSTKYDNFGNIKLKTTPLGHKYHFRYDGQGHLLESEEPGKERKTFKYDKLGRLITCTEGSKTTTFQYDLKGNLLSQNDFRNNSILQKYDCFGRCIQRQLPQTLGCNGEIYTPTLEFTYDIQGNIVSEKNANGEVTLTKYNILKKPTQITYCDNIEIYHYYNTNGSLEKTIQPDKVSTVNYYDLFGNLISKQINSPEGKLLRVENWTYNCFHPTSHTEPTGLTTHYRYNFAGRKTSEQTQDRLITYAYDLLGNLSRTTQNGHTVAINYNLEGQIERKWDEDEKGKIENLIQFFYDEAGRKEKIIHTTSQGEAQDTFQYDDEDRIKEHIDPLNNVTTYIYDDYSLNLLNQQTLKKTTINPLGHSLIEFYDTQNRLVRTEQQNKKGKTVGQEELLYDRAGNVGKNLTTIYQDSSPIRTHTIETTYDCRGNPLEQLEENEKKTTFSYDPCDRLCKKTLPSGTKLIHIYDDLGRLSKLKSSDKTIHYTFHYNQSDQPTKATDNIQNLTWKRTYNAFGEIIEEILPNEATYQWDYDTSGRCTQFTLPDASTISYKYTPLHMTKLTRRINNITAYKHKYTSFDENGHVSSEQLPFSLGIVTTTHDILERPLALTNPFARLSIEYGPSGLIDSTENTLFGKKTYRYDPLDQLTQEGDKTHTFDSLGNPQNTNHLNQILKTKTHQLRYDENGNPIQKTTPNSIVQYTYDALNRLRAIQYDQQKTTYTYDPFNRLYSKLADTGSQYYLYDREFEIGTFTEDHTIQELKILGLGLNGDIGAAIAIELDSKTYIPLHDFSGNIIALLTSSGTLIEKTDMDAFGESTLSSQSISPWGFNSKRKEQDLIFFGARFYDPSLGRWLTPDPIGPLDSPNLYLYVHNSPLNRLDLFGLFAQSTGGRLDVPSSYFDNHPANELYPITYRTEDMHAHWDLSTNRLTNVVPTFNEKISGVVNLFDHFDEIFPKEGKSINIITYQNGIGTSRREGFNAFMMLPKKIPENPFIVNMYNPTASFFTDIFRAISEMNHKQTPIVKITGQMIESLSQNLHRVNPKALMLSMVHSEAGAIADCLIQKLPNKTRSILKKQLIIRAYAPAVPLSKAHFFEAKNYYSEKDNFTIWFAKPYMKDPNYDIKILQCLTPINERTLKFFDHGIMGRTLHKQKNNDIKSLRSERGFLCR